MFSSTVPVLATGWRHRQVKTTGINILSGSRTFYYDNLWVTMATLGVFPKVKSWFVQPESENNICISERKRSCTRTPDSTERLPSQNADADQSGGCARSSGGKHQHTVTHTRFQGTPGGSSKDLITQFGF